MKRRALILGVTGQLGSYLADLLLEKDYEVFGLIRRTSTNSQGRIRHLLDRLILVVGDLTDTHSVEYAVQLARPHEVYNCAAQTHVGTSYREPVHTMAVTGIGAVHLFEAIRTHTTLSAAVRVYQASSSEMFGNSPIPQTEETPFAPRSPYACAKVFAHHMAQMYRQAYGLFIACGIHFNFESPRRGEDFVTRTITRTLGRIVAGTETQLRLGNLAPRRDWSHAKDAARAAWLMLQHPSPDDYVIASGVSHSVFELAEAACTIAGVDVQKVLVTDPTRLRPTDVLHLEGCANKARRVLGWTPTVTFQELIREMVEHDRALAVAESGCASGIKG